jgi:hypothetical protein
MMGSQRVLKLITDIRINGHNGGVSVRDIRMLNC